MCPPVTSGLLAHQLATLDHNLSSWVLALVNGGISGNAPDPLAGCGEMER
jgi:hypothetical protein